MVSFCILVAAALLFALAFAKRHHGHRAEMTLHEYITSIPPGFVDNGPADPNSVLDLRIALAQSGKDGLIEMFHNVSMPGHPSFGQYLSSEDVLKLTAPAPETVAAVNAWLHGPGLNATTMTLAGDWLRLNMTVGVANTLLDANFSVFTDTKTGARSIRTLNYSIPANLVGHLDFVYPTISSASFPSSVPLHANTTINSRATHIAPGNATIFARADHTGINPTRCDDRLVTPNCVQRLHGIPAAMVSPPAGSIAVTGMLGYYANKADLVSFLEFYRPDIPAARAKTFGAVSVNGGQNPQDINKAGEEANIDIQYTVGIATGIPTTFYIIGSEDPKINPFEALLDYFQSVPNHDLPNVLLIAYSANERAFEANAPLLLKRICEGYAALGTRGVSVIVSSADAGVGGSSPTAKDNCPDNKFVPVFPASCPYVTSVGSTTIQAGGLYQVAAGFSGGGFSNVFTSMNDFKWQKNAVEGYLQRLNRLHPEYEGLFQSKGRAYPDVSAIGTNVAFDYRNQARMADGTSFSAPIFASIIAMINAERFAVRKAPLGFLNEFLYANPQAFVDIKSGSNPGCNTDGFPATPGWDPVTGLGTPVFDALKAAGLAWP
ncbi:hypothetical protein NM688_g7833 [Phlebia brevispora]|uniref:Uncharacterized protein n=1 Tax=Phlebia brevispora TaxID=194682 RepID=A0ACC1S0M8_9APHY|nr:hypothetical protein NM688_g7833 [Phlebia brevispora]